ncbi:hypothetical protein Ciccas_003900 [Cichlidogyrus casuarinus]|uniref:Uncharacterized protein n=1 Tax=Cichlidogyrus casuarinus TaxID=1844966 RepID=A0ABD2QD23_9PLAT
MWANAFLIAIVTKFIKLGKKMSQVAGGKRYEYCNDAWFMFILYQLPLIALHLKGSYKVTVGIIEGIPAIWTTMFTFLLLDSISVFMKSKRMVRSSTSKGFGQGLLDFYNGKDTRPIILGFDVKVLAFRMGLFTLFSIIAAMVMHQYETRGHVSPGLGFIFASYSVRLLDYILFEHKYIPFFRFSQDHCGYRFLQECYIAAPFLWSLMASFSYIHPEVGMGSGSSCDCIHMGIATTVFLLGYYISRMAENQRYAFRTDPHHPRFATMEKIPTTSGRRLLAGGWWGLVRFPNYLGGLLMTFSWAIPAGRAYPYVWLLPLIAFVRTLSTIHHVEQHMISKHGAAFTKYKASVPKRLIPGVL